MNRKFDLENQCVDCVSNIKLRRNHLCVACEKYANQDYISQRELPLSNDIVENILEVVLQANVDEEKDRSEFFDELLTLGDLNDRQQQILRLRFIDDLSFSKIAKQVGLSKVAVFKQHSFCLRKLKERLTNLLYMRDGSFSASDLDALEYILTSRQKLPLSPIESFLNPHKKSNCQEP